MNETLRLMNKRGTIEIGAIILVIITTIGAGAVFSESKNIYVGDNELNEFYNYDKCPEKVNSISKENQIIFKNIKEAESRGYTKIKECV